MIYPVFIYCKLSSCFFSFNAKDLKEMFFNFLLRATPLHSKLILIDVTTDLSFLFQKNVKKFASL